MIDKLSFFIDSSTIQFLTTTFLLMLVPGVIIGILSMFFTEFGKILYENVFKKCKIKSIWAFFIDVTNVFILSILVMILSIKKDAFVLEMSKFPIIKTRDLITNIFYHGSNFLLTFGIGLVLSVVLYKYAGKYFFNHLKSLENKSLVKKLKTEIEVKKCKKELEEYEE